MTGKILLNPIVHQAADLLRVIGMRDRLRCPNCRAVGTWKPHGGWLDRDDTRGIRRWLCKWCGYYLGADDIRSNGLAVFDYLCEEGSRWRMRTEAPHGTTPLSALAEDARTRGVSPWRG